MNSTSVDSVRVIVDRVGFGNVELHFEIVVDGKVSFSSDKVVLSEDGVLTVDTVFKFTE